jgi:hypothetical protein
MKRICRVTVVLGLAVFLLFTTASLAPAQSGPFYVGVFGAYVVPRDLDVERHGDINLDNSWAIGAKGGYIIPPLKWLVPEIEYTYLAKQDVDQPGFAGDIKSHNLMGNLLFRYPEGRIHPYAGVGLGLSRATIGGSFNDDDTAFARQFIAGINFDIAVNMSAEFAYKYFASNYKLAGNDTNARNHMLQVGINFHF